MHLPSWFHDKRNKRIFVGIAIVLIVVALVQKDIKKSTKLMMDGDDAVFMGYGEGRAGTPAAMDMAEESVGRTMAQNSKMIAPYPPASPGAAPLDEVLRDDRLIIRNGNISAVVNNVRTAIADITARVNAWEGFISSSSVNEYDRAPTAYVTVRIPVEQFDAFFQFMRDTYRVVSENISGDDVTEQYVDNEARLNNLRASEEQFLEIMERATEIEDVLNVQQQLERVRGEIERLEAQQENLSRSAALSTVSVSLSTEQEELPIIDPSEKWSPLATFKNAIREFRLLLIGIADALIANSLYITAAAITYLAYLLWQRMHRR